MKSTVKIGTRGSALALYQSELVRSELKKFFPLIKFELVKIRTKGDAVRRGALLDIGPGIFTREIEEALLRREIDLAVHSAKDLASVLPEGLLIGAILKRDDSRDCLVARGKKNLRELAASAKIGTSSLRRKAQLKRLRPDLEFRDMRGNVDTRMEKIKQGELDAMVIAYAGLKRLGLGHYATDIFDPEIFLPQAGQGALAVEMRADDSKACEIVKPLNDELSAICIFGERSFLKRIEGGCQVPAGIHSQAEGQTIRLKGAIFSLDGEREAKNSVSGPLKEADELGHQLAETLLTSGGAEILEEIRNAKN
jgi:hydroxymethylbilane synthase